MRLNVAYPLEPREPTLVELDVPVPSGLGKAFPATIRASLCGREGGPLVVVLGGISANRFVACNEKGEPGWWASLVTAGGGIDLDTFAVLGIDFAADEQGEAAPAPADQASIICAMLDMLGIEKAHSIVGASYGGMVALAFAERFPDRVDRIAAISAGACPHPFATGLRELQRRVVDLGLRSGNADEALSIARGLAMLSYRTPQEFEQRFAPGLREGDCRGSSASGDYLRARGDCFRSVMSPERFLSLSASIDRHVVDPARIATPTLVIGAQSDQLVPPEQLRALHAGLAGPSQLHLLPCLYGHDMFLKEPAAIAALVKPFLEEGL